MRRAPVTFLATLFTMLFCASLVFAKPNDGPIKAAPPVLQRSPNSPVPPPQKVRPRPHPDRSESDTPKYTPPPAPQRQSSEQNYHEARRYHPHVHDYPRLPYVVYGAYPYYYWDDFYPYPYSPYYLPPAYVPAEQYFGPYAAMRVFGMVPDQPTMNANAGPWRDDRDIEPKKSADRATNAQSVALAGKFLGYGDALFAQQKYATANDRYRKAATSAPQMPEPWFRQGFAMAATGRYDLAVKAIKRGMKLDPKWPQSGFELDELYGDDKVSKSAHLDALANVAEGKSNDSDLLFLIGVRLHFDGQPDRAKIFFNRAAQLTGDDLNADHIRAFLKNDR